ncbi:MAG: divergent polysaccharide deacetylase family protein [Alphaproteobacteria bacterium]|nr:divergent polysaccharide deacetylase family protein [Alphaproteobacteria bacterium]
MSDKNSDQPSRLSSVAILPWMVALVLFLVLAGSVTMLGLGLTADRPAEPNPEMAQDEQPAMAEAPAAENEEPRPAAQEVAESHADVEAEPPLVSPVVTPTPPVDEPAMPVTEPQEPVEALEPQSVQLNEPPVAEAVTEAPQPAATSSKAGDVVETEVATAPSPPAVPEVVTRPSGVSPNALPPAPDPGLVETSPLGPLPRIGLDGREPWKVYARPHNNGDERPKVAIILSGLGLSSAATEAAIQDLPSEVTLAYQPFADNIQQWIRLSRAAGHEVLLNLPMEPVDFPANDPGPRALFVTLSPEENQDRMRWALSRVSGYVGVVNHMGSRFTTSQESMQPILAELKARGLLFVDARSAARSVATSLATQMEVPRAINDRFLDNREVSRATVDARLAEVERIAQDAGVSIAIGQAFPVTIERIREWAATLDRKGIALVPISAVVDRQSDR